MKVTTIIKTIFITITVALTLFFTWEYEPESSSQPSKSSSLDQKTVSPKRVSRFLEQSNKDHGYNHSYYKNPRAADHCHKDHEICELNGYQNATCCNNKCTNLGYDSDNCGHCKKKCLFTQVCCRGECVDTAYDKRHCGRCHNKCFTGQYCIYGMCDYP